jgi:hypothetical protein
MVFCSLEFLVFFLLVGAACWALPRRWVRNGPGRRPRAQRRAAVVVFTALGAFVALQLAALLVFEVTHPGLIDPTYGDRLRRIRRAPHPGPVLACTVVALGSSHVQNALADEEMSAALSRDLGRPVSVTNAAFPACGPSTALLTWRRLWRDGVRPDLLLVEACAGAVTDGGAAYETSSVQMAADRLSLRDLPLLDPSWVAARPDLGPDAALGRWNTLYRHRLQIVRTLAPGLLPAPNPADARQLPAGPFLIPPEHVPASQRRKALEVARGEYSGALRSCNPDGPSGRALRELVASAARAGIPVALVLMPEGPVFRSWYPPGTRTKFEDWLERTAREFGATLIDARAWMAEDDFVDSHHLMAPGARRFTERLGREYVLPLLLRQPYRDGPVNGPG